MPGMRVIADQEQVAQLIERLTAWVGRTVAGHEGGWALVGLKSRGDVLAHRVAQALPEDTFRGRGAGVGSLDITLYRDDLSEIGPQPVVQTTEIDFAIDGINVMLIDDVLMSGRTVRAALAALLDLGRPRRVWLAVLADRGGRELPICPDFAALDLRDDPSDEKIKLTIRPIHEKDQLLAVPSPQAEG